MNTNKIEEAVLSMMEQFPPEVMHSGTTETPARVAKAYGELLSGYDEDPAVTLTRVFEMQDDDGMVPTYNGMVILRDIELYSLCEHHMLPFVGRAHVAYIPNGTKVVGISKLARVVDTFARRLQVQERLTAQIADAIEKHLQPEGVSVIIEAKHLCICMRGVGKQNSVMVTSEVRGSFKEHEATRNELYALLALRSV